MRLCEVEGCGRKYRARGFCDTHYARWHRVHGDETHTKAAAHAGAADRLRTHIVEDGTHLIWQAQYHQTSVDVPRVGTKLHPSGNYRVWLWEELHGPLEGEFLTVFADPLCPVGCVTPEHLHVGRRNERSWFGPSFDRSQLDYELLRAVGGCGGNRSAAARFLRMNRVQLQTRLRVLRGG